MYGVFSSGNQVETQKVVTGIEEGFAQSPYLKTGGELTMTRTLSLALALLALPAFPVGNLATATPNATVHGLELDTRVAVKKGLTLGITGSWNNFWTRQDRATYSYPSGAVTAQLWRYYETFQLRGTIHYHFVVDRKLPLVPYAGVGLGFASNRYEILAADLSLERYQTNFAMTVDVGTLIDLRFARSFGAGALVAFRYGFNTAKFTQPSLEMPMNLGLVIGLYSSF